MSRVMRMRAILRGVAVTVAGLGIAVLAGCRSQPRLSAVEPADPSLLTVAERSNFRATARHGEVVALLDRLAARSPLARRASAGTSTEGRELAMLILADPPVASAAEARAAADRKLVVLLLGNIHAGEVDGKEALPMLARDILADPRILRDLIVIMLPNYNADGNERVATTNRPGQLGPEEGMGTRENANGRDLNRDFVKVEEQETRSLISVMNAWDPAVVVDCHTTNGSHHRYVLTYSGAKVPAGDASVIRYSRETMLPAIDRRFEASGRWKGFWYGSFGGVFGSGSRDYGRWETYPAEPRFATNYVGLRNRLPVLSESYSYASFEERVRATREFCAATLEFAAANKREIRELVESADRRAIAEQGRSIAIRTRVAPFPGRMELLGFEEERRNGRMVSTGRERTYEVELWDLFLPEREVPLPSAYVIEPGPALPKVVDALEVHGIAYQQLAAAREVAVESSVIRSAAQATGAFQGHVLATYEVERSECVRTFPAGSVVVPMAQARSALAAYLLEPESEDGLATWNFFDCCTAPGATFPVHRVRGAIPE